MGVPSTKHDAIRAAIQSSRASGVVRAVVERHLTYLTWQRLISLERACREIAEVPGDVVECGVGLGGSGVVLATRTGRPYHGHDVFGMVPPPGASDAFDAHARYHQIAGGHVRGPGGDPYFGYRRGLIDTVRQTFESFGVRDFSLHQGRFEETLRPEAPIALAHVDCEWHDAVALCLERLEPCLGPGSIVVVDDYLAYAGVRNATDAFVAAHPEFRTLRATEHLVLRRGRPSVSA